MSTPTTLSGTVIDLQKGDITTQNDMDAIVNAANANPITGEGAMHTKGDPKLPLET